MRKISNNNEVQSSIYNIFKNKYWKEKEKTKNGSLQEERRNIAEDNLEVRILLWT